MNDNEDTSRFTIRDDEANQESLYAADAENLRIEKLSTRITLVAVLIPCLLVIVLAVAYLDIRHRVINTQHTGSFGVEKLSEEMESRFSSLSLKQAKIEAQLSEQSKILETTTAALQVNLKKVTEQVKQLTEGKPDQSALTALSKKTDATIAALQKDMADLNSVFDKFDDELANQIARMAEGLKKDQGRLAAIEKITKRLDAENKRLESEKLSRDSMSLTLGIERLSLQEMVKEKIGEVEKKIADLNQKVDALNRALDARAQPTSPSWSNPPTSPPPPSSAPTAPSGDEKMEEQTIN